MRVAGACWLLPSQENIHCASEEQVNSICSVFPHRYVHLYTHIYILTQTCTQSFKKWKSYNFWCELIVTLIITFFLQHLRSVLIFFKWILCIGQMIRWLRIFVVLAEDHLEGKWAQSLSPGRKCQVTLGSNSIDQKLISITKCKMGGRLGNTTCFVLRRMETVLWIVSYILEWACASFISVFIFSLMFENFILALWWNLNNLLCPPPPTSSMPLLSLFHPLTLLSAVGVCVGTGPCAGAWEPHQGLHPRGENVLLTPTPAIAPQLALGFCDLLADPC